MFKIYKRKYISTFNLTFELRYYPSYQGFEGTRSGATIFRPATNHSLPYTAKPDKIFV